MVGYMSCLIATTEEGKIWPCQKEGITRASDLSRWTKYYKWIITSNPSSQMWIKIFSRPRPWIIHRISHRTNFLLIYLVCSNIKNIINLDYQNLWAFIFWKVQFESFRVLHKRHPMSLLSILVSRGEMKWLIWALFSSFIFRYILKLVQ